MGGVDFLTPDRKETQEYLSNTLKKCLNSASSDHKSALKNLTECMRQHSSWFGNHKARIEPFLLKFLESSDKDVVKEAAVAFHFFQQTGSAGVEGINYSNNFFNQFTRLCATVHALYNELFENETEVVEFRKIDAKPFSFSPYPADCSLVGKQQVITLEITNCLVYLKAMILESYPVNKPSVPEYLVSIVERGLSIHLCLKGRSDEEVSSELRSSSKVLNEFQAKLLHFFKYVIKGSRVEMFAHTITKILVNTLKRSLSCNCFSSQFRVATYKVLQKWIPIVADSDQNLQETLIPLLTQDIVPQKAQVIIRVPQKSKSKKRKHKSAIFAPQIEEKSNPAEDLEKQIRCLHALEVLNGLIECQPSPELTKIIASIFTILQQIHTTDKVPQPYTSGVCQAELYATLVSLYGYHLGPKEIHELNLPTVYRALHFLTVGERSTNSKIARICKDGLIVLEKIAHPQCPSLNVMSSTFGMARREEEKIEISSDVVTAPTVNGDSEEESVPSTSQMDQEINKPSPLKMKKDTKSSDDDLIVGSANGLQRGQPEEMEIANDVVSVSTVDQEMNEPPLKKNKGTESCDDDLNISSTNGMQQRDPGKIKILSDVVITPVNGDCADESWPSTSAMDVETDEMASKQEKEDDEDSSEDDLIAYFDDHVKPTCT